MGIIRAVKISYLIRNYFIGAAFLVLFLSILVLMVLPVGWLGVSVIKFFVLKIKHLF